jgi:tetratricopeptide (TPR) repeat protein
MGMYLNARLVPTSGQTLVAMCMCNPPNAMTSYHSLDAFDKEDWDFLKSRLSRPDVNRIDKLLKALDLCTEAARLDTSDPMRRTLIDQAIQTSPELCAKAHYMSFELLVSTDQSSNNNNKSNNRSVSAAKDAIVAGRAFASLVRTDEFCKGNLYSFVPTRWYVRSLYSLGSFLLHEGDLDGADTYLKECIANDIHDKLGARHKQLLVALERGLDSDDIPWLLKARFGDDQVEDDIFSLWNYTRALAAFCNKGDCKLSNKLLSHAIARNPNVPPVLLAWELPKSSQALVVIGSEYEAGDYALDNLQYWLDTKGALEWLEKVYCKEKRVSPLTTNTEAMLLLVQGTRCITNRNYQALSEGILKFERLLEIVNRDDDATNRTLHPKVLHRKAICHDKLREYDAALIHYNSALCLCNPTDTEMIKELFYNRASCKEAKGDLNGALQDYTFVYQRMGAFSTAKEGIERLEARLNIQTSMIPPCPDFGVNENEDKMLEKMQHLSNLMPRIDPKTTVAAILERCSYCQRGGITLAKCSGCGEARFCSKECQVSGWKKIHKYVCKASKHRFEEGMQVRVRGLEKAQQHNGKTATVVRFFKDKERFCIELVDSDGQLSVRPQNLEKVKSK